MRNPYSRSSLALIIMLSACALTLRPQGAGGAPDEPATKKEQPRTDSARKDGKEKPGMETITLGAGCFWCVEAVLQRIKGVEKVVSGYMGGKTENPTYRQICTGTTGHAEVVEVTWDPAVFSTEKMIELFFEMHDPTTLNRQGADVGTQYRSAIFYHTPEQRKVAEEVMKRANESGAFKDPIVTEITPAAKFWKAEDYHQNYYNLNPNQGYCRVVIAPKLKKLGLETKD